MTKNNKKKLMYGLMAILGLLVVASVVGFVMNRKSKKDLPLGLGKPDTSEGGATEAARMKAVGLNQLTANKFVPAPSYN